jgi:hypothetical protein
MLRCTVGVNTTIGASRVVEEAAALPRVRSSTPHTDTWPGGDRWASSDGDVLSMSTGCVSSSSAAGTWEGIDEDIR